MKKKLVELNAVLLDKSLYTFSLSLKDLDIDEEFVSSVFEEYENVGFINLKEYPQIKLFFGVDSNPKPWKYNPVLAKILNREDTFSDIILFVDTAHYDEKYELMKKEDFVKIVNAFVSSLVNEPAPAKKTEKYEISSFVYKIGNFSLVVPFDNIDKHFETYCQGKFLKENIFLDCKDECGIPHQLMYRPGFLYAMSLKDFSIEVYPCNVGKEYSKQFIS